MGISVCLGAKGKGGGGGGGGRENSGQGHSRQGNANKGIANQESDYKSQKLSQRHNAPARTERPTKEVKSNKASGSPESRDIKRPDKPEKAVKSEKNAIKAPDLSKPNVD